MQHDFILLDRSGSMDGMWVEALSSVNNYVKTLAADRVDTGVTLAVFDGENGKLDFRVIRDRITPPTWKPVDADDATPRGMTPLSDAVGQIVALAQRGAPDGTQYDKVAIIIMTDGAENASRELSVAQARKLLDECRVRGWQVVFLGANFDNAAQATSYGTAIRQTVQSAPGKMGSAMAAMAQTRSSWGAGQSVSMDFSDELKEELAKPD
jgi:hypothetical protein